MDTNNESTHQPESPTLPPAEQLPAAGIQNVELRVYAESKLFGYGKDDALGLEQYRLLRARLVELQKRAPLKCVLVTSAWSGEGKTHVATNLALTIARESERRVLLVDADIHKPDVHRVLATPTSRD